MLCLYLWLWPISRVRVALTALLACGFLWLSGIPPWLILDQAGEAPFLGLWADFYRPYGIISLGHVVEKAVEIAPDFAGARSNLGNALNQLGR